MGKDFESREKTKGCGFLTQQEQREGWKSGGEGEETEPSGDSGPGKLLRILNRSVRREIWVSHDLVP